MTTLFLSIPYLLNMIKISDHKNRSLRGPKRQNHKKPLFGSPRNFNFNILSMQDAGHQVGPKDHTFSSLGLIV
jgi:hypothetical protein